MVNLAGSRCFARFRKNILILTKPRANAQRVIKSVVMPTLELFRLLGYYTLRHDVIRTNELGDSKRSTAITLRVRIALIMVRSFLLSLALSNCQFRSCSSSTNKIKQLMIFILTVLRRAREKSLEPT